MTSGLFPPRPLGLGPAQQRPGARGSPPSQCGLGGPENYRGHVRPHDNRWSQTISRVPQHARAVTALAPTGPMGRC